MAHRVQMPGEKPRFALLIAGEQGIGKDTAIEMCCPAIGASNVANVEPSAFDRDFNEFAASVLVRISEAANMHDMSKWAFNERLKVLIAGTPDYVTINPKYGHKYSVRLHCGVILTTNHLLSGIYVPKDDRRYDVIECASKAETGLTDDDACAKYFGELWAWFNEGGAPHIAAFLRARDLSRFSASNGQRKTEAHRTAVAVNLASDDWLIDILQAHGEPPSIRSDQITQSAVDAHDGMSKEKVAKQMHAAMGRAGYHPWRNPAREHGRWPVVGGKTVTIFVKDGCMLPSEPDLRPLSKLPEPGLF
jgi:hypothetical protein